MADRHYSPGRQPSGAGQRALQVQPAHGSGSKVLHKLHDHAPNPTQLVGILTLVVSGGILLLLTGLTVTGLVMGLIFFTPLLLISSPIWIPVGTVFFVGVASTLSMCGFAVAVLSTVSWLYRYFKGFDRPGFGGVDDARKGYAGEYGGYLQHKVKDAAPSA